VAEPDPKVAIGLDTPIAQSPRRSSPGSGGTGAICPGGAPRRGSMGVAAATRTAARAASKGLVHRNAAARLTSRLQRALNKLTASG